MFEIDPGAVREDRGQIAIQRESTHLGAVARLVAAIVMSAPIGIDRVHVARIKRDCKQGMSLRDTAVEHGDGGRVVARTRDACEEIADPLGLFGWTLVDEKRRELL